VQQCPSGALSVTVGDSTNPLEADLPDRVQPVPNGPYHVTGGVQVRAADGTPYEVRNRQTLCRCGGSANKPFCNGTHWHIGFEAP
ncbi:MAG: CDGSH iron-sulfur domain-containing protein, partial [Acidimicrobiia bacterium]